MKRVLIFDFDGVIVDSLDIYSSIFIQTCKRNDSDKINSKEDFLRLFEKNVYASMEESGFSEEETKKILKDFEIAFLENKKLPKTFDGVNEMLKELSKENSLFVITSNVSKVVIRIIETERLNYFKEIIGAEQELSKLLEK